MTRGTSVAPLAALGMFFGGLVLPLVKERTMEARAKVLGHAVHQMLVPYPLALLTTAIIFDVIFLLTGSPVWSTVSYWMIAAGIIGGLLSAVFGLADWTKITAGTRARSVGTLHGLGNALVVVLFATSWLMRRPNPTNPSVLAFVIALIGAGLLLGTSWLGGELVDRHGVGVDDGANLNAPSSLSGRPADEHPSHRAA